MRLPILALLLFPIAALAQGDLRISSPAFADGAAIPGQFTCQGKNVSPPLDIACNLPGAKSLVLIVEDPDAPSGTFTHWIVWNIPPDAKKFAQGAAPSGALEGTNDFGTAGYSGPCPPFGVHRYIFRLFALNSTLSAPAGASRRDIDAAMRGHVLKSVSFMGRYSKS